MMRAETQQTEKRYSGNYDNYKDNHNDNIPDYPIFSKEWEWEECCNNTLE